MQSRRSNLGIAVGHNYAVGLIVYTGQTIMANTVSENIRKLRQKKGISQDRLSKEADLALNTIVKIETGENPNPTVETLEKIAKALGVSVRELFKKV